MGKASRNRHLRRIAKDIATEGYSTTNENVDIKQVKSDRLVTQADGTYVNQIVPKVVFNTVMNENCARKIYKDMKKEVL